MTEEEEIRLAKIEVENDRLGRRLHELSEQHSAMIAKMKQDQDRRVMRRPPDPDSTPFKRVFLAEITGFNPTSGTPYMWRESYAASASIGTFASGRRCTSLLSGGTARELNGWRFIPSSTKVMMVEQFAATNAQYTFVATVPAVPNVNVGYALLYSSASKAMAWTATYLCSA